MPSLSRWEGQREGAVLGAVMATADGDSTASLPAEVGTELRMGTALQQPPGGQSCSRRGFLPFHQDTATPGALTHGLGEDPETLGRSRLPPAPRFTPLREGRKRTAPHSSLQCVAAPTTPPWLTPK